MSVQIQKRLFTVSEYHKMAEVGILPERGVELINGEIIDQTYLKTKIFKAGERIEIQNHTIHVETDQVIF